MKRFATFCLATLLAGASLTGPAQAEEINVDEELKKHFKDKRTVFNKHDWTWDGKKFTVYVNGVNWVNVSHLTIKNVKTEKPVPTEPISIPILASLHYNCGSGTTGAKIDLDQNYTWGHTTESKLTVTESTEVEADVFDGDGMVDVRQSLSVAAEKGKSESWQHSEAANVSDEVPEIGHHKGKLLVLNIAQKKQPDYLNYTADVVIPDDAVITMHYMHRKNKRHLHHTNHFHAKELRERGLLPASWKMEGRTKFTTKQFGETQSRWYDLKPEFVKKQCESPSSLTTVSLDKLDAFFKENVITD